METGIYIYIHRQGRGFIYCIVGNFHAVQNFAFFTDCSADMLKTKNHEKV